MCGGGDDDKCSGVGGDMRVLWWWARGDIQ